MSAASGRRSSGHAAAPSARSGRSRYASCQNRAESSGTEGSAPRNNCIGETFQHHYAGNGRMPFASLIAKALLLASVKLLMLIWFLFLPDPVATFKSYKSVFVYVFVNGCRCGYVKMLCFDEQCVSGNFENPMLPLDSGGFTTRHEEFLCWIFKVAMSEPGLHRLQSRPHALNQQPQQDCRLRLAYTGMTKPPYVRRL